MRRLVKEAFRFLSTSTKTEVNLIPDSAKQLKQRTITLTDRLMCSKPYKSLRYDARIPNDFFSELSKLTTYENLCFRVLQDKEIDYYPNNSIRGDDDVLKIDRKSNIMGEQNVTSNDIIFSLKNIRFVNSIVFKQDFDVFLTTTNYLQRLLNIRAVKRDLMSFICAAIYDVAFEQRVGKALTVDQVVQLLCLTNVPSNHMEDFARMKSLLLGHLCGNLESVLVTDYLQLILNVDLHSQSQILPHAHSYLAQLACVLATSCELTHFSLACQAVSLVTVAARQVNFHASFSSKYASIIRNFPLIFLSPARLHQFAKLDNLVEEDVRDCAECIVRDIYKFYDSDRPMTVLRRKGVTRNGRGEEGSLSVIKEVNEGPGSRNDAPLDMAELMERLGKVSWHDHSRQGPLQRGARRKLDWLSRGDDVATRALLCCKSAVTDNDDDSAISSSSNMTSPPNSPCVLDRGHSFLRALFL